MLFSLMGFKETWGFSWKQVPQRTGVHFKCEINELFKNNEHSEYSWPSEIYLSLYFLFLNFPSYLNFYSYWYLKQQQKLCLREIPDGCSRLLLGSTRDSSNSSCKDKKTKRQKVHFIQPINDDEYGDMQAKV